ncbi:GTP cyclohydrolase I FolE [Lutibacter citreus]|uniref:GTP cyclohydrolase I FolE n=1 Tax=Lutibacter citreus TaxID=2138210 RepID=UPI000DBE8A19|nr:GTP cyclohydrolase I FolE [Lutibacter citreus]
MRQEETLLNFRAKQSGLNDLNSEDVVEDDLKTGVETPLVKDAFKLSDEEKKEQITELFSDIMKVMGMDLTDDSLKETPNRVAKMYIDEIFSGLNPENKPEITLFENKYKYNQMLVEKDIKFYSNCEHHFVPFFGKVHVAYISSGKVIGLSKINRIVQYFAKRPQVQERLTNQIGLELGNILETENIAVIIDAKHLCVASRGIKDDSSTTVTSYYSGVFNKSKKIVELQNYLKI